MTAKTQAEDHPRMPGQFRLEPSFAAEPFPHAVFDACLDPQIAEEILDWLGRDAPWNHVETDFYEQYEFSCYDATEDQAAWLTSRALLDELREILERTFGCDLSDEVSVVAHKLVSGHRIGVHNDFIAGQETHRFVVQLNHGLDDSAGGFLMLFGSKDPADVKRVLRPTNLSGFAFEISDRSYHAVSAVHSSIRYSVIYSFFAHVV